MLKFFYNIIIFFQALSFGNNCPRFLKEFNSLKELPEIMKFNEIRLDFYNYLKENSGLNFDDPIYNSSSLYDQLLVEVSYIFHIDNYLKYFITS